MKKAKLLILPALFAAYNAHASGYQLNEYSATNMGRAFAGVGVVGDDYSAIAFNPAGMTLKESGAQVGGTLVEMRSDVRGDLVDSMGGGALASGPKGRLRVYKTLPHAFAQHKVNEKFYLGVGSYTPFGLASIYNGDWFGASHGIKTELTVIDNALAGAYKINDQWSFGSAIIARYVRGDLINEVFPITNSRNRMDLDGWGVAYNFGLMYEPVKDTRLGVAYRLNSAHTVKGDHTIRRAGGLNGTWDGRSQMTLPNQLTLSAFHKLNEKIGLSASARWTKWNIFDDFVMESNFPFKPVTSIQEKWKNVWTYSAGLDYYYNKNWTFRTGLSFDPTPIRNSELRTARIPDSTRTWATVGASYKYKNMTFDFGYAHLFMKTADINNDDGTTTVKAKAVSYSNMYGLQFQYDF